MMVHACNPTAREAEAGESLEPRRQRLQWVKITLLHSSMGDRARLHLKKKKEKGTESPRHTHTGPIWEKTEVYFEYIAKDMWGKAVEDPAVKGG